MKADIGKDSNELIIYDLIGRKEFLTLKEITRLFAGVCSNGIFDAKTCLKLYISYIGCGPSISFNATRVPVYLYHNPDGTSVKNMVHFAQLVITSKENKLTNYEIFFLTE